MCRQRVSNGTLCNTAPASDHGAIAQINTHELTVNAKNLVDNTVTEPS
jgi:hypothetical protein